MVTEIWEYLLIIGFVGIFSLAGMKIFKGKTKVTKGLKSLDEQVTEDTIKTMQSSIAYYKDELKRVTGAMNRWKHLAQETEVEEEDEEEASIEDFKPLAKELGISEVQLSAAMQIPQVKELLGSKKNVQLIGQLAPLLKTKIGAGGMQNLATNGQEPMA